MRKEDGDTILALVKKNTRIATGRISQRELRANNFVSDLFNTFEILDKSDPKSSLAANRARMQELVSNSTVPYSGRARYPNFSIDDFLHDLNAKFTIKSKPEKSIMESFKSQGVRAIFIILLIATGCGSDVPAEQQKIAQDLRESIISLHHQNTDIAFNLPIQQSASDTLLEFLKKTNHPYTRNILIRNIGELNAAIEKSKRTFSSNLFQIEQNKRQLNYANSANEKVLLLPSDSSDEYAIGSDTITKQMVPFSPNEHITE